MITSSFVSSGSRRMGPDANGWPPSTSTGVDASTFKATRARAPIAMRERNDEVLNPMKHPNRLYWIVTSLMAAFMSMASIPDILRIPQAVEVFTHLGYPTYLLPFIGVAKMLGVIAVLVPGFHRLKEWAYAGLIFDLLGALYSHLAVGDPPSAWSFPIIGLVLVAGSYQLFRRRLTDAGTSVSGVFEAGPRGQLAREMRAE